MTDRLELRATADGPVVPLQPTLDRAADVLRAAKEWREVTP